jgi:hypothetical protein
VRPAGPVEAAGTSRRPRTVYRLASEAAECAGRHERTVPDGSVDRGCVGSASGSCFGLFAPVCDPRGPAFVFSSGARSCPGLSPLSGLTGASARVNAACTNGCGRTPAVAFHRSPGHGSPAAESALGFASEVSASRLSPASNTSDRRLSSSRRGLSTVRASRARRDKSSRSSPLTSLQRIEATDALPIPSGSSTARVRRGKVRRGPAPCLRFCTVRAEI